MNKYFFLCGGETTKCFAQVFIPKQTANENFEISFSCSFERKRRNRAKKGPSRLLIISAVFRCSYKKNVSIYARARGYLCVVNLFSLLV